MAEFGPQILLAALLAVEGTSVGQFMFSRPLVAGFLAGFLGGDAAQGLVVGGLLEIFFLPAVPLGGGRYPEPGPATVVGVAAGGMAGGPAALAFGVFFGLTFGLIGGWAQEKTGRLMTRWVPLAGPPTLGSSAEPGPVGRSGCGRPAWGGACSVRSFGCPRLRSSRRTPLASGCGIDGSDGYVGRVRSPGLFTCHVGGNSSPGGLAAGGYGCRPRLGHPDLTRLPGRIGLQLVLRSFMIQSSWNTRTMLGHGFGFALKPALWWRYENEAEREAALARHVEHFNAHPYLATMGLGAVARIEVDGGDPSRIRDFKTAVRGPLGAIGDRLVWVGWLPVISLSAIVSLLLGVSPFWVVLAFLGVYNAGHIVLRFWAWFAGYEHGADVAEAIRRARLQSRCEALSRFATVLLGVVLGIVTVRGATAEFLPWLPLGGVLFFVGNGARTRGWRPALSLTAALIGAVAIFGVLAN